MDAFFITLVIYFLFGGFMPLIVFLVAWVFIIWLLNQMMHKYLSMEDQHAFEGIPFPTWMRIIMVVAAVFPAFILASFIPI